MYTYIYGAFGNYLLEHLSYLNERVKMKTIFHWNIFIYRKLLGFFKQTQADPTRPDN